MKPAVHLLTLSLHYTKATGMKKVIPLSVAALTLGSLTPSGTYAFIDISAGNASTPTSVTNSKFHSAAQPTVGIQLTASRTGTGSQTLQTSTATGNPWRIPVAIQIDFEPITSLGTLALGPSVEYLHFADTSDASQKGTHLMLAWSYGGQIRYSAHYSEKQWLVPTAAYHFQRWNYKRTNAPSGEFNAQGPSLGAWLYLNAIDRESARTMRTGLGIQRAYLTLDWKRVEGSDSSLSITGDGFHLGLRLEI